MNPKCINLYFKRGKAPSSLSTVSKISSSIRDPFSITKLGRLLSERYLPPVFRCFCFCIHHPGTALLYKLAPRHHRFHTCGLLFIVRHVQQQCVEVLEHIQVVCLCVFYQAVDDGTGSRALYRIVEKDVLSPRRIGFRTPLQTPSITRE